MTAHSQGQSRNHHADGRWCGHADLDLHDCGRHKQSACHPGTGGCSEYRPGPRHLLYDKAAVADWIRELLVRRDVALVCPHRWNRKKQATRDGHALPGYRRRYRVERSIRWLNQVRRLMPRREYHPELPEG